MKHVTITMPDGGEASEEELLTAVLARCLRMAITELDVVALEEHGENYNNPIFNEALKVFDDNFTIIEE